MGIENMQTDYEERATEQYDLWQKAMQKPISYRDAEGWSLKQLDSGKYRYAFQGCSFGPYFASPEEAERIRLYCIEFCYYNPSCNATNGDMIDYNNPIFMDLCLGKRRYKTALDRRERIRKKNFSSLFHPSE